VDEQVLNLSDSLQIIRRYLRLILALTLLGLAVTLAYVALVPAMPSAQSIVLLPPSSADASGQPTRDVATEVEIATSQPVLESAARKVRLVLSYSVLQHRIAVTALTTDVLQVTAQASTGRLAEDLANAVARSFVNYSNTSSAQSNQSLPGLEQQSAQLGHEIADLQQEINTTANVLAQETPGSIAYQHTQQVLVSLQASEDQYRLQSDVVNSNIVQAKLSTPSSGVGTVVLQSATRTIPPSALRTPTLAGLGALCGLAIGALIAFALGRRDRRLRRRDDIARAAEAPVLQSLSPQHPKTANDWLHLFQDWRPSVTDRARLRRVFDDFGILDTVDARQLDSSSVSAPLSENASVPMSWRRRPLSSSSTSASGASRGDASLPVAKRCFGLTVIALAGDRHGLTVAPELGVFAATLGISVAFVVGTDHESTATLRRACAARNRESSAARQNLFTYERPPDVESEWTALTVTLVVVDPKTADLVDWSLPSPSRVGRSEATILAVSSGFAVAEELAVATKSVARDLPPVTGILVANPDPADKTTGQFPPVAGRHTPRELTSMTEIAR
jgi:capsular polysaccharide biosynthesis protein